MNCPPSHGAPCVLRALRRQVRMRLWRSRRRLPTVAEVDDELLHQLARRPDLLAQGYFEAQARQRRRAAA